MDTALAVVTPPAVEPVSVALARQHCRIDSDVDDSLVGMYITAARVWAEGVLARALVTQTLQWTMSERAHLGPWPGMPTPLLFSPLAFGWPQHLARPLELPRAPVQSVTSVAVRHFDSTDVTLDPSLYTLDLALQPARLILRPAALCDGLRHIQVTFVAGYDNAGATVPQPILLALLVLTAFLYEQRGDAGGDMPPLADALLAPYRIAFFGG